MTAVQQTSAAERFPSRRRVSRWSIAVVFLLLVSIMGIWVAPRVVGAARALLQMPGMFVGAIVQAVGQTVALAVEDSFATVLASEVVKQRLGEPLQMPAPEQVQFLDQAAGQAAGTFSFRYTIGGPHGDADVAVTMRTADDHFEIAELIVAPVDGSGAIDVVRAPAAAP